MWNRGGLCTTNMCMLVDTKVVSFGHLWHIIVLALSMLLGGYRHYTCVYLMLANGHLGPYRDHDPKKINAKLAPLGEPQMELRIASIGALPGPIHLLPHFNGMWLTSTITNPWYQPHIIICLAHYWQDPLRVRTHLGLKNLEKESTWKLGKLIHVGPSTLSHITQFCGLYTSWSWWCHL